MSSCDRPPTAKTTESVAADLLQAGTTTISVPLPPGVPLSAVALGANSTLLIGSNVSVSEEGSSTALPEIVNAGTGTMSTTQTKVSLTASLWSVGSVFLATGTTVAGAIATAGTVTEQTGVTVSGTVSQGQSLSPVPLSVAVTFPSSSMNVTLQPGQSTSLAPGAYASVIVNSRATLTLQSGTYYFNSLDVEPQGTVALTGAGPFVLNVQSTLTTKGQFTLPAATIPATFVVVDTGSADVFLQGGFDGTLIAPNSNVTLAPSGSTPTTYHGSYFGKSLTLQAGVAVLHRTTPSGLVVPVAECVIEKSDGTLDAVFGYNSPSGIGALSIPTGADNFFEPSPTNQGQPQTFQPGRQTAQFAVPFNGKALAWVLNGVAATASRLLPVCTPSCVQQFVTPGSPPITTVLSTPAKPVSVDESIVMRDSFRWMDTLPLPANGADGSPNLYYGLVYLSSSETLEMMDALRVNYSNVPLFDTEMSALDQQGIQQYYYPNDGQGQFVYAMMPAATYNAIRTAALDSTQPVQFLRAAPLRPIPKNDLGFSAQTTCGLQPIAQCVAQASNGSLRAVFSYNNPASAAVTVPAGADNLVSGGSAAVTLPEAFNTGTHTAIFAVPFNSGTTVSWTLEGQTVTENAATPRCSATITNEIGVDHYNPFPAAAPATCRSATPQEGSYPNSHLPPAARANTCTTLAYTYAEKLGFQWRGVASDANDASGQAADADLALGGAGSPRSSRAQTTTVQSALFGHLFRSIAQGVASVAKGAVDDVRRVITAGASLFVGEQSVTVQVQIQNIDPTMAGGNMVQAWGTNFGQPISLQGIELRASRSLFLSLADLNSKNQGTVNVLNDVGGARICFAATNGAAHISGGFLPDETCTSMGINTSPSFVTITPSNTLLNLMAQFTDASLYVSNVMGVSNQTADVIDGPIADNIGKINGDAPFTPCLNFSWDNNIEQLLPEVGIALADKVNQADDAAIHAMISVVFRGLKSATPTVANLAAQTLALSQQLASSSAGAAASAALNAVNAASTAVQTASTQVTLLSQDGDDFVSSATTAGTLQAQGSPQASAAANVVQTTTASLSAQSGPTTTALQNAQGSLASAVTSANALVAAVSADPTLSSELPSAQQIATALNAALSALQVYENDLATVTTKIVNLATQVTFATIGEVLALSPLGQYLEFIAGGDILFPASRSQDNVKDRGIATHEYGHFTFCNLMDRANPSGFASAYDEAAADSVAFNQDPTAIPSVINESFADTIASQVVGATNYATPTTAAQNSLGKTAGNQIEMTYCLAADASATAPPGNLGLGAPGPCIEVNTTNSANSSFPGAILRDVSLFTDAFDGQNVQANVPSNGAAWSQLAGGGVLNISAPPGFAGNDEVVSLPGGSFPDWITHTLQRGTSLTEDNVFGALDDAMIDAQVNYCARCQVFWLHTVDSGGNPICPASWVGQPPNITINGTTTQMSCVFQGTCPAGTNPNPATQVCDPPCPGTQVFDPVKLQCVDSIHIG